MLRTKFAALKLFCKSETASNNISNPFWYISYLPIYVALILSFEKFSLFSSGILIPFEMIKSFGITYKAAGENIAGNPTLEGAVTAWMNSEGHRANILSNAYNYTGIGVVESQKYGKVMVQMFIGK